MSAASFPCRLASLTGGLHKHFLTKNTGECSFITALAGHFTYILPLHTIRFFSHFLSKLSLASSCFSLTSRSPNLDLVSLPLFLVSQGLCEKPLIHHFLRFPHCQFPFLAFPSRLSITDPPLYTLPHLPISFLRLFKFSPPPQFFPTNGSAAFPSLWFHF